MKQKDFLIILIPAFVLTILWVIFSIYHNYVTSTIKDPLSIQILPIQGKFDTKTIEELKNRERVNPLYEAQKASVSATEEPTITEEPTLLPTETPILTPTPSEEDSFL